MNFTLFRMKKKTNYINSYSYFMYVVQELYQKSSDSKNTISLTQFIPSKNFRFEISALPFYPVSKRTNISIYLICIKA